MVSGTPDSDCDQDISLTPIDSGNPDASVYADDTWSVWLNGTEYKYEVKSGDDTFDDIATGLKNLIDPAASFVATASGGVIHVTQTDDAAVSVGKVDWHRVVAADIPTFTPDTLRDHYLSADITLQKDGSLVNGEKWAVTLHGKEYSYTVTVTGEALANVAENLAGQINADFAGTTGQRHHHQRRGSERLHGGV